MVRILIEVSGGVVTNVIVPVREEVQVHVIDHDDISIGEQDPADMIKPFPVTVVADVQKELFRIAGEAVA